MLHTSLTFLQINFVSLQTCYLLEEYQLDNYVNRQHEYYCELVNIFEKVRHFDAALFSDRLNHEVRAVADISHRAEEHRRRGNSL